MPAPGVLAPAAGGTIALCIWKDPTGFVFRLLATGKLVCQLLQPGWGVGLQHAIPATGASGNPSARCQGELSYSQLLGQEWCALPRKGSWLCLLYVSPACKCCCSRFFCLFFFVSYVYLYISEVHVQLWYWLNLMSSIWSKLGAEPRLCTYNFNPLVINNYPVYPTHRKVCLNQYTAGLAACLQDLLWAGRKKEEIKNWSCAYH